ncbi:MAG: hypothetical protein GSR86_06070 [Desulfurococcales archaeon]|nr:hypothetical protein [Desulfurococcales archaeon]
MDKYRLDTSSEIIWSIEPGFESWCTLLRKRITSLLYSKRDGTYTTGDIVLSKKGGNTVFVWIKMDGREVLAAWGPAWSGGRGYRWRCLDERVAKKIIEFL